MSKLDLAVKLKMIDKITAPARKASEMLGGTGKKITALNKKLKNIDAQTKQVNAFKKTTVAANKHREKLDKLNDKLSILKSKTAKSAKASETLKRQIGKQSEAVKKAQAIANKYGNELKTQSKTLKKVGIATNNLSAAENRLQASQSKSLKQISKLNKRTKKLQNLRKGLGKVAKMGAIGGAVGGVALYKLGGMLRSTANDLDAMTKAAQNMKLPLDEFQALRHQAELTGVENAGLTKSFQTFNKNLGELKTKKSSLLSTALKDFQPKLLKKLSKSKNATEAYEHILKTIQKIPDASKQAALANAAFGREGKNMLIMLRQGEKGLIKARKDLQDLGGGATEEDVKAAEDFNDAITRMSQAFNTVKFSMFTPMLKELTGIFKNLITQMKDKAWRDGITDKLKSGFKTIVSVVKSFAKGMRAAALALQFVAENLKLVTFALIAMKVAALGNPIIAIITFLATVAYLIYDNWADIKDFFQGVWDGIVSIFYKGVALWLKGFKILTSVIPDSILPESMTASGLDKTIKKYEELSNVVKATKQLNDKIKTDDLSCKIIKDEKYTKSEKSKIDVNLKIESDKPVNVKNIKKVGSHTSSNINIDTGNFAMAGF